MRKPQTKPLAPKLIALFLLEFFWLTSAFVPSARALGNATITRQRGNYWQGLLDKCESGIDKDSPTSNNSTLLPEQCLETGSSAEVILNFKESDILVNHGARTRSWFERNICKFYLHKGTVLSFARDSPKKPKNCNYTVGEQGDTNATVKPLGTAFFIRHEADTTLVGVLSHSVIVTGEVTGTVVLEPGQLVLIQDGEVGPVQNFNLRRFYQTSEMAKGLGCGQEGLIGDRFSGEATGIVEAVAEETCAAADQQQEQLADIPVIPPVPGVPIDPQPEPPLI